MKKLSTEIKEKAIETLKERGTMRSAAMVCGVSIRTLNEEMRRSEIFKRRVIEARAEGKQNVADTAIDVIKRYAYGDLTIVCDDCDGVGKDEDGKRCKSCKGKGKVKEKTDRNRLTAAIALANAYELGFRGQTQVGGKIEHDVRVITAVPRPNYEIETSNKKQLKVGTIEDVIEGEVINESDS